jgi:dTDP-4-amino-4,6-dideoxygalactose transaminase
MRIPISRNWFGEEELAAVARPLRDGWVVQGPRVKEFETAFSLFTKADISLACSSGTAALQIAVAALGLQPGDEVVVPGFTWIATPNVVELLGGRVRFCDIELQTFNLELNSCAAAINPRTVGIIPVHLFGLCAEMEEVLQLAAQHHLWVVEDAACGLGASYRQRSAGTLGDIGCFSFHPRKSITTGEGGMLTTSNSELARRCDGLRNHGALPPSPAQMGTLTGHSTLLPDFAMAGFNYRMTDIQGALGSAQMNRIEWLLSERSRCAAYYRSGLENVDWLRLPTVPTHQVHAWQSFVTIYAPEEPSLKNVERLHIQRNRLMGYLEERGIASRQGTHAPAHQTYYATKYEIRPEDLPNSYLADRLSLALPVFPGMSEADLSLVCHALNSFNPSNYSTR